MPRAPLPIGPGPSVAESPMPGADETSAGAVQIIGTAQVHGRPLLGVFASVRVPPDLVLRSLDIAVGLRERGIPTIGGFQSTIEREILEILLRGRQTVVACPARSIDRFKAPFAWATAIREGRMSVVSCLDATWRRSSARSATVRNRLVVSLATGILVIHAQSGSRAFKAAEDALSRGKPVYCPDHSGNRDLILIGAQPFVGWDLPRAITARLIRH